MGAWGYGVFDNDRNLDFKDSVEEKVNRGVNIREACENVSKSNFFEGYKEEITLAKAYIFKENDIELSELENKELKTSIANLLEEINNWAEPDVRKESLHNIAKGFNINP